MTAPAAHGEEGFSFDLIDLSPHQVNDRWSNPLHLPAVPNAAEVAADDHIVVFSQRCLLIENILFEPGKLSVSIAGNIN